MNAGYPNGPDRLERALQASLRPVDPGVQFTVALQARLVATERLSPAIPVGPSPRQRRRQEALLALAASTLLVLAVGWQLRDLHIEQDVRASREQSRLHTQVLLALEITSERLGRAQQTIEQYQLQENRL